MVYSGASLPRPRVYVHCLRVRLNTDKQDWKTSVRPITPRDASCLAPFPSCRITGVGEGRVPVSASREGPATRRTGAARVSRDCCFAGSCAGSPWLASVALSLSLSGYRKRNPSSSPQLIHRPSSVIGSIRWARVGDIRPRIDPASTMPLACRNTPAKSLEQSPAGSPRPTTRSIWPSGFFASMWPMLRAFVNPAMATAHSSACRLPRPGRRQRVWITSAATLLRFVTRW